MNIIIFGATGGTGKHLVEQAVALGHNVTVFCRTPEKLASMRTHLKVIQGDALELGSVSTAVRGQEAVICALGMPNIRDKSQLRSQATRNIISAMQEHGIKRLICLSAFGAGDSYNHLPWHYRYLLVPLLVSALYKDHNHQEQALQASQLDWTIIRRAILYEGNKTDNYQHGIDRLKQANLKVSRANLASFMLRQLHDQGYLRATPTISE